MPTVIPKYSHSLQVSAPTQIRAVTWTDDYGHHADTIVINIEVKQPSY